MSSTNVNESMQRCNRLGQDNNMAVTKNKKPKFPEFFMTNHGRVDGRSTPFTDPTPDLYGFPTLFQVFPHVFKKMEIFQVLWQPRIKSFSVD